jgi:V/A-type H+-transporting ATPase subunit I
VTEMRKLAVVVFEDDVDAVIRSLGEAGIVQFIDMREKLDEWKGTLTPHTVPTQIESRCSDALSRIDAALKTLNLQPGTKPHKKIEIANKKTEDILVDVEKKLAELPLESIGKSSTMLEERKTLLDKISGMPADERTKVGTRLLELRRLVEAEKQSLEEKSKLGEIREDLLTLQETAKMEREVAETQGKFARTAKTIYFEVWVPDIHLKETIERIQKMTAGDCITSEVPIGHGEKQPVVLKPVPSFLTAFEKLTLASGYPSAHEVNPTSIMAITFPILFGMMFADVGQGALFILAGVLLSYFKRKIKLEETGDIVRYLLVSGEMFVFLGISAVLWGLIFGEFFGPSGLLHPIKLGTIGPFYIGGFEPMHEPMKMIRFAILIGALHISLGLILKLVNNLREHEVKHAPIPVCWLWLLWGGLFMWAQFGGISSISRWFAEGGSMLAGLIIAPLILLVVFTGIAEGPMEGIGFGVEVFAETLSHTLSYGRLMALGLVHSVMNYLFLELGGVEHGHFPLSSIPIIATGTILVMIIEGLIVFVHTLRLHWIEWFSKFYSGEGIPFKPFKFT